jgi:uncharacterized protein YciI
MDFDRYYLVLLKKGPAWSPEATPELAALQEQHLAHIQRMRASGKLALAGPTVHHSNDDDIRGVHLMHFELFDSIEAVMALVEQDPAFQSGRLVGEYLTWYVPKGTLVFPDVAS